MSAQLTWTHMNTTQATATYTNLHVHSHQKKQFFVKNPLKKMKKCFSLHSISPFFLAQEMSYRLRTKHARQKRNMQIFLSIPIPICSSMSKRKCSEIPPDNFHWHSLPNYDKNTCHQTSLVPQIAARNMSSSFLFLYFTKEMSNQLIWNM